MKIHSIDPLTRW